MNQVETRQANRDSLFLLARIRVDGQDAAHRARVRNLSAGGMMAECNANVARGTPVAVELRNIGWVEGSVAWTQGDRFGIAFVDAIDPSAVRDNTSILPSHSDEERHYNAIMRPTPDPEKLRKI